MGEITDYISKANRYTIGVKSCCPDFESHRLDSEKRGVGVVTVNHGPKRGLLFLIQNWDEGSVYPHGGFAIKFCPWCGKELGGLVESHAAR